MNPPPRQELLSELGFLHAHSLLRMPWIQAVLVLGIGLVMTPSVPMATFFGWGALSIAIEVVRARYAAHVLRRGAAADAERTHAAFVVLAALAGAAIGAGAVVFLPKLPLLQQALLGVVLLAIPAAGAAVAQSSRYVLGAYAGFILLPSSLTWGYLHPSQAVGAVLLTVLLYVVLLMVAAGGDKLLLRSIVIRHERDRLVLDLEARNTEVQAAKALAEQSAQARARVLAAASHDLRQPLHALSVYSAVLGANPAPETLGEVSQNIDQIVRALGNLLNGLLDLSRLSAGFYVPERQDVSLDRLAAGVCAEYEQAAAQKGLVITRQLEPVRLIGDPVALGRIVRNLVDNAIKYTEAGGLHLSTGVEEGDPPQAVFRVKDTGRGIPETEQRRIFEEFYQLDNPGRDRGKGVGLGLAIVQRLTELIGATVTVESTVGVGTTFSMRLPVTTPAAQPLQPQAPQPGVTPSLKGRRVYVIDDERDILAGMSRLLPLWGMQVATAESPTAAQALFDAGGAPDLMIVDLRLGNAEHGGGLARRLQAVYGKFPVLIITGETSSDALREANAQDHVLLQKPIAPEILLRAMSQALASVLGDSPPAHAALCMGGEPD